MHPDFLDCEWLLSPDPRYNFITLRFTHLMLEGGFDFLYVHDGANASYPMQMRGYNQTKMIDMALTGDGLRRLEVSLHDVESFIPSKHRVAFSSGPAVYMRFKSDVNMLNVIRVNGTSANSNVRTHERSKYAGLLDTSEYENSMTGLSGFVFEYQSVFCAGLTTIYEPRGTITDRSGPERYTRGQYCLWALFVSPNATEEYADRILEIRVNASIHNSDALRIFDGPNTSSPLLYSFHNTTATEVMLTTTSASIIVEFATDMEDQLEGF